jgi:hypothetical protein
MNTNLRLFMVWCLLLVGSYPAIAQISTFSKVMYDSHANIKAYCCGSTLDHNFIIGGEENNNAFASKLDSTGSILWSKTLGTDSGAFYSVVTTPDSCFVFAGFTKNQGDTSSDVLCVKINSTGDTVWTRMIDMGVQAEALSIRQTFDNGFILTGNASGEKIIVVKLDALGHLSWGKLFSGAGFQYFGCGVSQTSDTGYIVTGYFDNSTTYIQTMYLLKLTSTGTVTWMKQLNSPTSSYGFDVLAVPEGIMTYLLVDYEVILMKSLISGNISWSKSYTASSYSWASPSFKLHRTSDGGYLLVTGQEMNDNMIRVDVNGNLLSSWDLVLYPADVVESDGGEFIAGDGPLIGTKENQNLDYQVGLMKTDSAGSDQICIEPGEVVASNYSAAFSDITCTSQPAGTMKSFTGPLTNPEMAIIGGCVSILGGINEHNHSISIAVFPNPNDGVFNITVDEAGKNEVRLVEVYNFLGERIYVSSDPSVLSAPIIIGRFQDGVYDVRVSFRTGSCTEKIVVCH